MGKLKTFLGAASLATAMAGTSCVHDGRINGFLPIEETFFVQCHDNELDFDTRCVDFTQGYLADAKEGVYLFNQDITADVFGERRNVSLDGICSSILLNNGYLLTAQHCVDIESDLPFGVTLLGQEFSISRNGQKYALEKIALGGERDVALFKVTDYEGLPYVPFALGNTDSIKEGNFVYLFGFTGLNEVNVRDGIVGVAEDTSMLEETGDGHFLITNGADHGDSGGMVIGIRDGVPEVLGVLLYGYHSHAGGCLKMKEIPENIMGFLRDNQ